MKLQARVGEKLYQVELTPIGNGTRVFNAVLVMGDYREEMPVEVLDVAGQRWTLLIRGQILDLLIVREEDGECTVEMEGRAFRSHVYSRRDSLRRRTGGTVSEGTIARRAQMPGKVIRLLKDEGDQVDRGEGVVVIEAMKMQNEIRAPKAGTLAKLSLVEGTRVNSGDLLFEIE